MQSKTTCSHTLLHLTFRSSSVRAMPHATLSTQPKLMVMPVRMVRQESLREARVAGENERFAFTWVHAIYEHVAAVWLCMRMVRQESLQEARVAGENERFAFTWVHAIYDHVAAVWLCMQMVRQESLREAQVAGENERFAFTWVHAIYEHVAAVWLCMQMVRQESLREAQVEGENEQFVFTWSTFVIYPSCFILCLFNQCVFFFLITLSPNRSQHALILCLFNQRVFLIHHSHTSESPAARSSPAVTSAPRLQAPFSMPVNGATLGMKRRWAVQ